MHPKLFLRGEGPGAQGCSALLRKQQRMRRLLVICAARGAAPTLLHRFPWQRRPGETRTMLQDVVSGVSGALHKLVRSTGEGCRPGVSAAAGGSGFAAQAARCRLGASLGGPRAGIERPGKSERFGPPCWLPGRRGRCCHPAAASAVAGRRRPTTVLLGRTHASLLLLQARLAGSRAPRSSSSLCRSSLRWTVSSRQGPRSTPPWRLLLRTMRAGATC